MIYDVFDRCSVGTHAADQTDVQVHSLDLATHS